MPADYPIGIHEALQSLTPNGDWHVRGDTVEWIGGATEPTDAEIAAEITRLQGVRDGLDYARARKKKYDLLNQDEMRFDDQVNSTTTWVDAINAIKTAHPKP
jgi:hypothetical protein